jgi:signal transduction histidine kinase
MAAPAPRPSRPPAECVDPDRIQQVVWNLLANAVKFTLEGGRVHVRVARVDGTVEIEVRDTGVGISPEFLPHVFDRLYFLEVRRRLEQQQNLPRIPALAVTVRAVRGSGSGNSGGF